MMLACDHRYHTKCWQRYFVANRGWCTCPLWRSPSHVAEHYVPMNPESFGSATPAVSQAPSESGEGPLDHSPAEAQNDASPSEVSSALFPWWEAGNTPGMAYHSLTRLSDGRVGVIVDTGAVGNLSGESWALAASRLSRQHGFPASSRRMPRPISVQGVGKGSQECTWETVIPAAIRLEDGSYMLHRFTSPCVPASELPALWGLDSLTTQRAIIDCAGRRMYLCGPGDIQIIPPPGTQVMPLDRAPSGHLVLPISSYEEYKRWAQQSPEARRDQTQLALATQPAAGPPGPRSRSPTARSSTARSSGPLPAQPPSPTYSAAASPSTSPSSSPLRSPPATDRSKPPAAAVAYSKAAAVAAAGSRESRPDQAARAGDVAEVSGRDPWSRPSPEA